MAAMTTTEVAEATAKPIHLTGRGYMMWSGTAARAEELGLTESGRFGFWVNGRAGVLGDVDARVAASAIGFMAPSAVAAHWEARPAGLSAWDAALAWFGCCAAWGREHLASMPEDRLRRLADLARTVIDASDCSIGPLYAGSTLIPLPGDAAGDAAININVLRELRGAAHLAAGHAVGLGPHGTIMSTDDPVRGGVPWAETFGWSAPHPDPDPAARAQIEEMTTGGVARAYECLSGEERAEFAALCADAHAQLPD